MNNFKKLLASAMALSMVTSVMPATGVNADFDTSIPACGELGETTAEQEALANVIKRNLNALVKAIEEADVELENVKLDTEIVFDGEDTTVGEVLDDTLTINTGTSEKEVKKELTTIAEVEAYLAEFANSAVKPSVNYSGLNSGTVTYEEIAGYVDLESRFDFEGYDYSYTETIDVPVVGYEKTFEEALQDLSDCTLDETAAFLGNMRSGINETVKYLRELNPEFYEKDEETDVWNRNDNDGESYVVATEDGKYSTAENIKENLRELKQDINKFDKLEYVNNLGEGIENNYDAELYAKTAELIEEARTIYFEEFPEDVIDAYASELEKKIEKVFAAARTGEAADWEKPEMVIASTSKLKDLKKLAENIEEDKDKDLKAIAKYEDVADEVEIEALMDSLNEAIDRVEYVLEITSKKDNDLLADYLKSIDTGRKNEKQNLSELIEVGSNDTTVVDNEDVTTYSTYDLTTTQIDLLEDVVEEIGNAFFETNVRAYDKKYSARVTEGEYFYNLSSNELKNVASWFGIDLDTEEKVVDKGIFELVSSSDDATWYSTWVEDAKTIRADLDAMTTNIKGVTINNLSTNNANKVLTAKKAVEDIEANYEANLTVEEAAAYKEAKDYVDVLYTYMLFNGIVAEPQDWWVQSSNGEWVFYQDGKVQEYTWVASNATDWYYAGKNGVMVTSSWIARDSSLSVWYYVNEDGLMVRDTTIDGYYIDANGEWHA